MLRRTLPLALLSALPLACGGPPPQTPAAETVTLPSAAPSSSALAALPAPATSDAPSEIDAAVPITPIDPTWGSRTATVTIVFFGDFQCPFTARSTKTVRALEDRYGPDLRVVWKNDPLPFHPEARPAAEVAAAVQMLGGSDAFWKFFDQVFANPSQLGTAQYESWATAAGVSLDQLRPLVSAHAGGAKVDKDVALAKQLGVAGTPAFFVNGTLVSGAQTEDKFASVIDAEMTKAKAHLAAGTSPSVIYTTMADANYHHPIPSEETATAADTTTVWEVPIGGAPARGGDAALVTIVEFADFQCPFCKRAESTLDAVRTAYGEKVRIVWRDEPLAFHQRALASAELAREVRAEKGNTAFWSVHDALFASQPKLEDADLDTIAKAAGADLTKVHDAIATEKYKAAIDKDTARAKTISAAGVPTFFINGRRLVGAQPLDKFKAIIDEEITRAQALLAKGTPRAGLYEAMIRHGRVEGAIGVGIGIGSGKPGATTVTPDGLSVTDLAVGKGPEVKSGDYVTVHYTGTLDDGTVFDSSRTRGQPFSTTIGAGRVIKGWDEGIPGMKVGGRRKLLIPAALAYGDKDRPKIPAGSRLTFDVELLKIGKDQ